MGKTVLASPEGCEDPREKAEQQVHIADASIAGVDQTLVDVKIMVVDTNSAVTWCSVRNAATNSSPRAMPALHDVPDTVGVLAGNVVRRLNPANAPDGTIREAADKALGPTLVEAVGVLRASHVHRGLKVDRDKHNRQTCEKVREGADEPLSPHIE